jgi:hypothetical protein
MMALPEGLKAREVLEEFLRIVNRRRNWALTVF